MKKTILFIALFASATLAQASLYVGGSVGYLSDAKEPLFSARVGYQIGEYGGIRHSIEGEIGVSSADFGIYEVDMQPRMINYRGEIDIDDTFFAYAGAGLGSVQIEVEFAGFEGDGDGFAWQVFGGLGMRLTEQLSAIGGLRFIDASDIKIRGESVGADNDLEFGVGMQFVF